MTQPPPPTPPTPSTEKTEKRSYKKTLNLPKTAFAMKANLVQREPQFQKRWDRIGLFDRMLEARADAPVFTLHDGPPYANGSIHLGHLLNKVLKDLVVRSQSMLGRRTPFVPGWDCHGLPIEHKVMKELGGKAREMETIQIRRKCKAYAEKFIKLQMKQMQRLGTVGEYERKGDDQLTGPYFSMDPVFEAGTLEVFADLVERGLVFRQLKPVHWSIENRTALAEAELEYEDREDTSVYVLFEVANPADLPLGLMARPGLPISLMIWTTTPWTLPANLAVAVSGRARYGLYRYDAGDMGGAFLMAEELAEKVLRMPEGHGEEEGPEGQGRHGHFEKMGVCTGEELEAAGIRYVHPFIKRESPVVTADYVTLEDGTGLVHTAPGHGVDDYHTGLRCGLDIYCPVREDGTYDDSVPEWLKGVKVWDANGLVVERLRESGHLFHDHKFMHSYPHDWRSKTPTIFRATEQWFVGVDRGFVVEGEGDGSTLRERALSATASGVKFVPEWGRNRMRGMLENRPDWCVSRQRAWGLPIPAFFGLGEGQVLLTPASVKAVVGVIREKGSDVWFLAEANDLLAGYNPAGDADAPDWVKGGDWGEVSAGLRKGSDIFDVWFESGSSWHAVCRQRGLEVPVDLYLEGSDQHRGWFQSSLLPALGVTGRPPYKTVLTHGFMVDKNGRKMSKSVGNTVEVEDLLKELGADVCRWWVASLNTDNDIKVDMNFFREAGEEYRKVRNTIRFLLSNLSDFDNGKDRRELGAGDAASVDAWAATQLAGLIKTVRGAYESFAYRRAREAIFNFCNDAMSAVYLAATKDRLYCDKTDSDRRRRTQTVMYDTVDALVRLIAPILVHTADEAWLALRGLDEKSDDCVHVHTLPNAAAVEADENWDAVMELRDRALKHLEDARAQRGLDNPMDAGIEVALSADEYQKVVPFLPELADLCGVSRFMLDEDGEETVVIHDLRDVPRCERSWKRDGTVKVRSDGGELSDRDAEAVGV